MSNIMLNYIKTIFAILTLSLVLSSCSSPDSAYRLLDAQGYTEIETGGYAFLMCSEDDQFSTSFTATNVNGRRVSGAVCSGFTKGATIRFR